MCVTYLISQQLFDRLCVRVMVGLISYSGRSKTKLGIINLQKYLNQVS